MKDKVVLITGAGSGIGEIAANLFAEKGASLVVADLKAEAAERVVKNIIDRGFKAIAVSCDVSNEAEVEAMVEKTIQTYGRLDIAYNNAGIQIPPTPTHELRAEDFDRIIAINLRSVFLCMKYELREMLKTGGGSIVNNSSISGINATPQLSAYVAAKHGIVGLTKTVGAEYADRGIRVNAVCPGTIVTPMVTDMMQKVYLDEPAALAATPMHRFADPKEVASVVLFLSSDAASYVNGQAIAIDGGQTIV